MSQSFYRKNEKGLVRLVDNFREWAYERNIINGSNPKHQFMKLIQEAGELSDNICKGKDISDDVGDILVVLTIIAEQNGLSLTTCAEKAWKDIKDRKGIMVDGVFIKEQDYVN